MRFWATTNHGRQSSTRSRLACRQPMCEQADCQVGFDLFSRYDKSPCDCQIVVTEETSRNERGKRGTSQTQQLRSIFSAAGHQLERLQRSARVTTRDMPLSTGEIHSTQLKPHSAGDVKIIFATLDCIINCMTTIIITKIAEAS